MLSTSYKGEVYAKSQQKTTQLCREVTPTTRRGEEKKKAEKRETLLVLAESEHIRTERLQCLHTARLPRSKHGSDRPGIQHFTRSWSQTPSLEGTGACGEGLISSLGEDCCCKRKTLQLEHLGSLSSLCNTPGLKCLQTPEK